MPPDYQEMTRSIGDVNRRATYEFLDGFGCPERHCSGTLRTGRNGAECNACHTTVVPRD